ncbi:MAG: rod shape-determining protein MreD [Bacteroidales bacterium]|jgi:rod shape-determining protein MreD
MINNILKYGLYAVILVLIQLLVCNNIQFSGYINPYVYLLFILILPVDTPSWLLLLVAFLMGLIIDIFSGTFGLHAFATTFVAFIRPAVLGLIAPHDGYQSSQSGFSIGSYGFKWFLIYSSILVFVHHFVLFFLEVFRMTNFFNTFLRVLLSSLFSVLFILLFELIRKGK